MRNTGWLIENPYTLPETNKSPPKKMGAPWNSGVETELGNYQ